MREIVVCIHGIWMKGWLMKPLAGYLTDFGHECRRFSYPSLRSSPQRNAQRLGMFTDRLDADVIHFVAHSLGGIVLLHYFQIFDSPRPGRVVMLGPPLKGSGVAHFISRNVVLKHLTLGASSSSLLGNVPAWRGTRPLAVLAGTRGLGIGQMLGAPLERPNDGAVAVSETRVKSCTVHKLIPYSHTGMLLAKPVAAMIDEFLRTGNIT